MTVLFQGPSIGLVLLALPQVLRAKKVVFYRPYGLAQARSNSRRRASLAKLIRWMNAQADVTEQDPREALPLAFENNLASDRAMDDFFPAVARSASFAVLRDLIRDSHLDRFYKIRLLPWVLNQTQFYRTARHRMDSGEEICIVPDCCDRNAFRRSFLTEKEFRCAAPPAVRVGLRIRDHLSQWLNRLLAVNLLFLFGAPVLFLLKTAWRAGIRRRAAPIRADVVMPLIWGFNPDGRTRGVRTGVDDSVLLDEELNPRRVAFYFSDWTFIPEERRALEERMARRGIRSVDPNRFPLTLAVLRDTASQCGQVLKALVRRLDLLAEDRRIALASSALLYNLLKHRLFNSWVEYKVFLERQDYSAAHVIRTILAGKLGRLTAGDHHAAPDGAAGFPVLRYTHIHRHGVWGEAFLRSYGPHWDQMVNTLIGCWRSDFVMAAQQRDTRQELENRFRHLYGGRRPVLLVLFPTLDPSNLLSLIREEIEGLRLLSSLPQDFTAVCRFRSAELAEWHRALGLEEVIRQDSRIVIDLAHFSTYEWIALADAVIVSSISSGMIEAAAAGKPTFSFDHRLLAERVFSPYGKDLILKNRYDLVRVLGGIASGFRGFDCQWDQLARDFSRYSDGECIRRYRQMLLRAVEDVETQRSSSRTRGSNADPSIRGDDTESVKPPLEQAAR